MANEELRTLAKEQCAIMQEALAIRARRDPDTEYSHGFAGLVDAITTLASKLRQSDDHALLIALVDAHKEWDVWYSEELAARGRA